MKILFLCVANSARSQIAEGLKDPNGILIENGTIVRAKAANA